MFLELAITLTLLWLVWFVVVTFVGRRKMPPGPFPLPFVGNAHQVGMNPPFSMETLREKYGDIYTISFPVGTFVVVNSGKLMQEALVSRKDDFAGRPDATFFPLNEIFEGTSHKTWRLLLQRHCHGICIIVGYIRNLVYYLNT